MTGKKDQNINRLKRAGPGHSAQSPTHKEGPGSTIDNFQLILGLSLFIVLCNLQINGSNWDHNWLFMGVFVVVKISNDCSLF